MRTNFRWTIGGLLFFASMINYIDRSALPIVAPMVQKDLGIDAAHLGLIFSIFFVGYAIFNFVGGYLSDRVGVKRVYGVAMFGWSIFSGLTAIVTGFWQLMVFRILFGLGEGPMGSVSNKTVRNWFPRKEAGFMVGMATTGGNLAGAAFAGPVVGLIAASFGWRAAFVVTMVLGFAWLCFWLLFAAETPAQSRRVNAAERAYIEADRPADVVAEADAKPLSHYLKAPIIIAVAVAFFAANYTQYFLLSWMPSYLTAERGLDIKQMSIVTVIPWMAGLVGCALGGFLSDRLISRTRSRVFGRKVILVGTLVLTSLCLGAVMLIHTSTQAVTLMALALFLEGMTPVACWALIQDVVPSSRVGGVGGYVHLLSNISGIIGPGVTGLIVQYTGGYNPAFLLAGLVALAGAAAVLIFVRDHHGAPPQPVRKDTPQGHLARA